MSTQELHDAMSDRAGALEMITEAYKGGQNLTMFLEEKSPSENKLEFDAFDRLMKLEGIQTQSYPDRGYWASKGDKLVDTALGRALYTEFFARTWRRVAYAKSRATYLSTEGTPGSWQRPYDDAMPARWDTQIAPAIPLSELIAIVTPVTGADYRSFYLTHDATKVRHYRIGESAEIPTYKLADSENTIQLQKFGLGLEASYEQIRRMRVDKLAMQITRVAIQNEVDKVAAALNIAINGDGNSNSPTTYNLTTLDTDAVAGTLTLAGWLAYKLKFVNPYLLTTALMQEAVTLQLALLDVGSANVPLAGADLGGMVQSLTPINMTSDGVRYGWTSDAPALQIVGFDRRWAMEELVEIGGQIAEMERFVTRQTEFMSMTEVNGFAKIDATATLILDINA
jgi:hypothetical protein